MQLIQELSLLCNNDKQATAPVPSLSHKAKDDLNWAGTAHALPW